MKARESAIRDLLTDPAIVNHCELGVLSGLDGKGLIARESDPVRRFGMQDVFTRHERNMEAALCIRLELGDLDSVRAADR